MHSTAVGCFLTLCYFCKSDCFNLFMCFLSKELILMKTFAIANQKGGVGKTTTAVNLSAALTDYGKKVMLVDIDPQGNATSGLGIEKSDLEKSIYDVLIDDENINEVVHE